MSACFQEAAARALLVGLCTAACGADLALSGAAHVSCGDGQECPPGRICSNAGFCVATQDLDTTPPDVASGPVITPAVGRAGTEFEVALVATKPLAELPSLTLALDPPLRLEGASDGDRLVHRWTYVATGEERGGLDGRVPFDVRLVDGAGNVTIRRNAGTLGFDFQGPTLVARSAAPEVVRLGGEIDVFFATDEPLAGPARLVSSVDLVLDGVGQRTFAILPEPGTLNHRFVHMVRDQDAAGEVGFSVTLQDLAGNESPELEVGHVEIDNTPPALAEALVWPLLGKEGTEFVASFAVTKELEGQPKVTIGGRKMERDGAVEPPATVSPTPPRSPPTSQGCGPSWSKAEIGPATRSSRASELWSSTTRRRWSRAFW